MELKDLSKENYQYFEGGKLYPPGAYKIVTCRGAWKFHDVVFGDLGWAVSRAPASANDPPGGAGWFVSFARKKYDGTDALITNNEDVPSLGANGYASQRLAEESTKGCYAFFLHGGGAIGLRFRDNPYSDNTKGSPNPTYGLYLGLVNVQLFRVTETKTGENAFHCVVGFTNTSEGNLEDMRLALTGYEGIASPTPEYCTSQSSWELNGNASHAYAAFDWSWVPANGVSKTITVEVQFPDGTSNNPKLEFEIDLTPVIVLNAINTYGPWVSEVCAIRQVSLNLKNNGYGIPNNLVARITATSGASILTEMNCNSLSNGGEYIDLTYGVINGNGGSKAMDFYFKSVAPFGSATFTVSLFDGSMEHPGFSFVIPT